jgi:protein subunit release factor A
MEAEGSLISAREERRRLEEMERETRDMPELAAEKISKGSSATAELHPLYRRHREAAEKSLLAMRAIKGLAGEDADICAKLAAKIEKDLTAADSQWKAIESRLKELLGPSQQEKQQ